MHDQNAYKIPKLKKEFQIQLNDGTKTLQSFTLFLNEFSKYSKEKQTLLEFLNDSNSFIPSNQMQSDKQDVFIIINKNEICYIIDHSLLPVSNDFLPKQALFLLKTGQEINASIYQKTPKEGSRVIDYLSNEEQFIELVMEGRYFIYLNKNFILKVVL